MMIFECDACGSKWFPGFDDTVTIQMEREGWHGLESPDGRRRFSLLCKDCNAQYEGSLVPAIESKLDEVERVMTSEWLQSRRARSSVLSDLDLLPPGPKEEA